MRARKQFLIHFTKNVQDEFTYFYRIKFLSSSFHRVYAKFKQFLSSLGHVQNSINFFQVQVEGFLFFESSEFGSASLF